MSFKQIMVSAMIGALALALAGESARACTAAGTGVVLTVGGPAVTAPNRPAFSEAFDRLHAYRGNKFDKARAFTLSDLAALPMQAARAFSPDERKAAHFEGPSLADVLKAAGVEAPKSVALQAIDGYEVKLDPALLAADAQVLALCREGVPLALGGMGPVFSVIPLAADRNAASEDQANRQVWGLLYIGVE